MWSFELKILFLRKTDICTKLSAYTWTGTHQICSHSTFLDMKQSSVHVCATFPHLQKDISRRCLQLTSHKWAFIQIVCGTVRSGGRKGDWPEVCRPSGGKRSGLNEPPCRRGCRCCHLRQTPPPPHSADLRVVSTWCRDLVFRFMLFSNFENA